MFSLQVELVALLKNHAVAVLIRVATRPQFQDEWSYTTLLDSTVGAIAGGAGGYSVFATTNQAGSAILLLLGGLSLLIALTGRVPEKMGKDGAVFQPTLRAQVNERVVQTMLTSTEADVQRAAAATYSATRTAFDEWLYLSSTAAGRPRDLARSSSLDPLDLVWDENLARARAVNLETNILELLRSRFTADSRMTVDDGAPDRFDFAVRTGSGAAVAVEVKGRALKSAELDRLVKMAEGSERLRGLVVVQGVRDMTAQVRTKDVSPSVVVVTGPANMNGQISERFEDTIFAAVQNVLNR